MFPADMNRGSFPRNANSQREEVVPPTQITGDALEQAGQDVLHGLGLDSFGGRRQVRFRDLDPSGTYPQHDHIEIDYLVPNGNYCAVGEITSRVSASNMESKYRAFIRTFHILETIAARLPEFTVAERNNFWTQLGVPPENTHSFRQVRSLRGFVVCTSLERYDVKFDEADRVAAFYAADWRRIKAYQQAIGEYGKPLILHALDIPHSPTPQTVTLSAATGHAISVLHDKRITGGSGPLCNIYTFEVSPYNILPASQVFRADQLPYLGTGLPRNYQRPLDSEKLTAIRTRLLGDPDFVFPGSILVVLSAAAQCSDNQIDIPQSYGAISVVDGQHRLFSYANAPVASVQRPNARIAVMAVEFQTESQEEVEFESARTFIEVNTNQSPVSPAHLYTIKYPILGDTGVGALAAQVLIGVNERRGALYGLLDTNQEVVGIIPPLTLLSSLRSYLRPERLRRVADATRGAKYKRRQGYERLFGLADLYSLVGRSTAGADLNAAGFIRAAVSCVGRYFDIIRDVFPSDWPERRGPVKRSSMKYAKFIAALIKLLHTFTDEGLNWQEIKVELQKIRRNVLRARNESAATRIVFRENDTAIPDASNRTGDIFKFLEANRRAKTPISRIIRSTR